MDGYKQRPISNKQTGNRPRPVGDTDGPDRAAVVAAQLARQSFLGADTLTIRRGGIVDKHTAIFVGITRADGYPISISWLPNGNGSVSGSYD